MVISGSTHPIKVGDEVEAYVKAKVLYIFPELNKIWLDISGTVFVIEDKYLVKASLEGAKQGSEI